MLMRAITASVPHVSEIQKIQDKLYELKSHIVWIFVYLKNYEQQSDIGEKKRIIHFLIQVRAEVDACVGELRSRLSFRTEIKNLLRDSARTAGGQIDKIENNLLTVQKINEYVPKHLSQMNPKVTYIEFRKEKFKETLRNVVTNSNFIIRSKTLANINGSKTQKIKCFSILWNTFFLSHIYIVSDKNLKKYKILDIVCTNNQDQGDEPQDCLIEAKTIIENVRGDQRADLKFDETQRNLQIFLFNLNRGRLVFKPSTVLYQKFTNWIRYMYFRKRIETNLENLINNYIKPYKEILIPEEEPMKRKRRCCVCQEKMKFVNLKEGFVPPTIFNQATNKYYHEKCYFLDIERN